VQSAWPELPPLRLHGGALTTRAEELGLVLDDLPRPWVDFSISTNPYGPAPAVVESIRRAAVDRYPDSTARRVRERLAETLGPSDGGPAHPDQLVVGNGAADLLWTLARVLLRPGDAALVIEPTFSEFAAGVAAHGGHVATVRAPLPLSDQLEGQVLDALRRLCPRVLYVCSPTTPTGEWLPLAWVRRWAELGGGEPGQRPAGLTVVLDEAFLSLSEHHHEAHTPLPTNVVRVRSLTKEHALPGVRLGYLVASRAVAARVEAGRPAWTTSSLAQAAALTALDQVDFVAASRQRLLADRRLLVTMLAEAGYGAVASTTHYVAVPVARRSPPTARTAVAAASSTASATNTWQRALARHGLFVRDCASFGMEGFVRFAARPPEELARLRHALATLA
jgi:histidinol-phosphate/aromatic aminotransferase/cobyric acid decarboxylase-like protein